MGKRERSLANSRCEAKKIYYQRGNIKRLEKENQELKEEIRDLEFIIGVRTERNLISKFDKEYDEEDKKRNPDRDYESIIPDAEEVYKRYYEQKDRIDKAVEYIGQELIVYDNESDEYKVGVELIETLKGDKE